MRDGWYRDPRVGAGLAAVAAAVQAWAAIADGRAAAETVLLALVAAALAGWTWLAILGIGRIAGAPRGADIRRLHEAGAAQHAFNTAAWNRFDRDGAVLRMLLAERTLDAIGERVDAQAALIERSDGIAETLPDWSAQAAQWYATASLAHASMPGATPVPTQAALNEARERLPADGSLSDADTKAALHFLVARQRLDADRAAVMRERSAALRRLAADPPPEPPRRDDMDATRNGAIPSQRARR